MDVVAAIEALLCSLSQSSNFSLLATYAQWYMLQELLGVPVCLTTAAFLLKRFATTACGSYHLVGQGIQ